MVPLPRLGMGTAPIGNLYRAVSDAQARATLEAAWDAGIRYFDTAPHYGFGLAERRLGAMLAERDTSGSALLSTKVGRLLAPTRAQGERHGFVDADPFEPVFDYSADAIRRSFEESCRRIGRDRIDLLLAHDLGHVTHGAAHEAHLRAFLDSGYGAMRDLRDAGAVRAIGIGVNEVAICETLLDHVELDVILLAGRYTLLDRSADRLLALIIAAYWRGTSPGHCASTMRRRARRCWTGPALWRTFARVSARRCLPPRCNFRCVIRRSPA